MNNPIGWIEIPTGNLERAIKFYETIFDWTLEVTALGDLHMAFFPADHQAPGSSGALVKNENYHASESHGPLVYFSCEDINAVLGRVPGAGGTIQRAKTQIAPDIGYMALILDSEGNRIALHSRD